MKKKHWRAHYEAAMLNWDVCLDEVIQLRHDVQAYRGALGYPVQGDHNGKLSDGSEPRCGLCDARSHCYTVHEAKW